MAKKNENRVLVPLICEECKTQNYTVSKNKKNTTERLEINIVLNVVKTLLIKKRNNKKGEVL